MFIRVDGTVDQDLVTPPGAECHDYGACEGACGSERPGDHRFGADCAAWSWSCYQAGLFGSCSAYTLHFLPPLRWFWDLYAVVATAVVARGVRGTIRAARRSVAARNLRTAREAHKPLPEQLIGLADQQAAAARSGTTDDQAMGSAILGTISATTMALFPPLGLLTGFLALLSSAFGTVIPLAVGELTDNFGRRLPVWESGRLSGQLAPDREPTHTVDAPPGDGLSSNDVAPEEYVRRPEAPATTGGGGVATATIAGLVWWLLSR